MATTHPYISGAGNITQMVSQLRKAFPQTVNSETVKKLGLAPNNESSVINVLQYVNLLDKEGKKTSTALEVFSKHKDEEFAKAFGKLVETAYSALFELHGQGTWALPVDDLITFFRQTDQTGAAIGQRQAATFRVLASLSGHIDPVLTKAGKSKAVNSSSKAKLATKGKSISNSSTAPNQHATLSVPSSGSGNFGLTVRVEINLPADGSKETYDNIFKSIRENLLNV
jgi:hypothetical protein